MATEKEALFDYAVHDVALVDRNTVVLTAMGPFVGQEPNIRGSSRLLSYNLAVDSWGMVHYEFGEWWKAGAGLTRDGKRQALFGAYNRTAMLNYADGPNGDEPGRLKDPATIDDIMLIGDDFYAVGGNEFLGRRDGPGEWTYLSLAASPEESRFSLSRLIGDAPDNIYAIKAEQPIGMCHWNGTSLRQLPPLLPDDMLHDGERFLPGGMAMSPDGQLFIGGHRGELLVGTADTGFLPLLYPEKTGKGSPRELSGLAWYDGGLWAVDGSQLMRLVGGEWEIQPVQVDSIRNWGFDYIYAGDGALLVGSQFHAVLFDGTSWRKVFGRVDIDKWQQLQLLTQQNEDMRELLESARALRDLIRSHDGR